MYRAANVSKGQRDRFWPQISLPLYTFFRQFRRQCMHFGNSAGNFVGSAVRRPVGHDSAAAMSKLVANLPNYMQIIQNWSEKGVYTVTTERCCTLKGTNPALKKPSNIPEIYAKMFGRFH